MKKTIISFICVLLISGAAYAKQPSSQFKLGIYQYKTGNYVGCMETMKKVVSQDPGDATAHYYLGMAYTQSGMKENAIKEYNIVITLNPKSALAWYAQNGLGKIGTANTNGSTGESQLPSPPGLTPVGAPVTNMMPGQLPSIPKAGTMPSNSNFQSVTDTQDSYLSEKAKDTLKEKKINRIIDDVNRNNSVDPSRYKQLNNYSNVTDTSKKSDAPSQQEIAQAFETLQKAGINGMNQYSNPETMQLNMLMNSMSGGMNSNNNSNSMNMLPLLMMSQGNGKQNIDPELMQSMVTNMMMPNMYSMTSGNNDSNY